MNIGRRDFILTAGGALLGVAVTPVRGAPHGAQGMYGLIGKMTAVTGKRDEMIAVLIESVGEMPGCYSYVVAKDPVDANAIWITEVWDSKASHDASLSLPAVKTAIARGRPLIASFDSHFITEPVGGHGLPVNTR